MTYTENNKILNSLFEDTTLLAELSLKTLHKSNALIDKCKKIEKKTTSSSLQEITESIGEKILNIQNSIKDISEQLCIIADKVEESIKEQYHESYY